MCFVELGVILQALWVQSSLCLTKSCLFPKDFCLQLWASCLESFSLLTLSFLFRKKLFLQTKLFVFTKRLWKLFISEILLRKSFKLLIWKSVCFERALSFLVWALRLKTSLFLVSKVKNNSQKAIVKQFNYSQQSLPALYQKPTQNTSEIYLPSLAILSFDIVCSFVFFPTLEFVCTDWEIKAFPFRPGKQQQQLAAKAANTSRKKRYIIKLYVAVGCSYSIA